MKKQKGINIPYVKEYNEDGSVKNPIKKSYLHLFENRKERRAHLNQPPFKGNTSHPSMMINGVGRFIKTIQRIILKTGRTKKILHYTQQ